MMSAKNAKTRPAAQKAPARAPRASAPGKPSVEGSGKTPRKRLPERHVLRLYITGVSRASTQAVERVRAICEEHLHDRYELEVIDIYQLPALAKGEQIIATPTLVRVLPAPLRRFIGSLPNESFIFGLDLREKH